MIFKTRAMWTCGCHYLDIPYAHCVRNRVSSHLHLSQQSCFSCFSTCPLAHIGSLGVIVAPPTLFSLPFSPNSACSSLQSLKSPLLISVSLVEGAQFPPFPQPPRTTTSPHLFPKSPQLNPAQKRPEVAMQKHSVEASRPIPAPR